jgi:hypothetical protein
MNQKKAERSSQMFATRLLPVAFALSPTCHTDFTLQQLYGQWTIWYSNHPQFIEGHYKALTIFPKKTLMYHYSKYYGPILCTIGTTGRFTIECTTGNESVCDIHIEWLKRSVHIDSIFGVRVNEIAKPHIPLGYDEKVQLTLNILEKDAMYLSSNNDDSALHLVKNIFPRTSPETVPLSTFIFTTILGNLLYHILHQYFKDFI